MNYYITDYDHSNFQEVLQFEGHITSNGRRTGVVLKPNTGGASICLKFWQVEKTSKECTKPRFAIDTKSKVPFGPETLLHFGVYEGWQLQAVPTEYLARIFKNSSCPILLSEYIDDNVNIEVYEHTY